eukprot:1195816-Prorocentrum_minimum.AAC.5
MRGTLSAPARAHDARVVSPFDRAAILSYCHTVILPYFMGALCWERKTRKRQSQRPPAIERRACSGDGFIFISTIITKDTEESGRVSEGAEQREGAGRRAHYTHNYMAAELPRAQAARCGGSPTDHPPSSGGVPFS